MKNKQRRVEIKHRRQVRRIVIPIFDESDLSNHSQSNSEFEYDSDSPEFTISSRIPSRMSVLLEDFLRRHAELQALSEAAEMQSHTDSSDSETKQIDNSEAKDIPNNKVGSESTELTYSAAFISMSDKSVSTDESKNAGPSEALSEPNCSKSPDSSSTKKGNSSKSSRASKFNHVMHKRGVAKRKRATLEDQENSTAQIRARVKRRAATVVWKRIIPKDSDSEMEEESKNTDKPIDEDTYTKHMVKRIANLPLPVPLLRYLNYRRNNM